MTIKPEQLQQTADIADNDIVMITHSSGVTETITGANLKDKLSKVTRDTIDDTKADKTAVNSGAVKDKLDDTLSAYYNKNSVNELINSALTEYQKKGNYFKYKNLDSTERIDVNNINENIRYYGNRICFVNIPELDLSSQGGGVILESEILPYRDIIKQTCSVIGYFNNVGWRCDIFMRFRVDNVWFNWSKQTRF